MKQKVNSLWRWILVVFAMIGMCVTGGAVEAADAVEPTDSIKKPVQLTEIVCIIDKSGSMSGLEKDTIGGINGFIEKQKKEEGQAIVSVVLFDTKYKILYDRIPLEEVQPLTEKDYVPSGATALLDAVGDAVERINSVHKELQKPELPDKTIVIITTDGEENSSTHYDYDRVQKMIQSQQKELGWEFVFFGANIDVAKEAKRIGIAEDRAIQYEASAKGVAKAYGAMADVASNLRRN